jgi:hypothetical protein
MIEALANVNSLTVYGTATTTSGTTAVSPTNFNQCDHVNFNNLSSDSIIFKTGPASVTVAFPTAGDAALSGTIVGPGQWVSCRKELAHTSYAVDSLTGSALYAIQASNGP